jgi:glycosyltransferase involved in cell wall biosynthesis
MGMQDLESTRTGRFGGCGVGIVAKGLPGRVAAALLKRNIAVSEGLMRRLADRHGIVRLAPEGPPRGRALIARRLDGFLAPGAPHLARHNQYGEAVAMAETLLGLGLAVDVVAHTRKRPPPDPGYDLLIASRMNFEAIAAGLSPRCLKIVYLDTMHWLTNNHASLGRSLEVLRARGVAPDIHIEIEENRAIETADCGILFGNATAWETYAFAGKPIFQIPNFGIATFPFPEAKDFAAARRRFLWLGSRGLAHKGLGRVLEAFAAMPEMELAVCGPLDEEPRFAEAYRVELAAPNVRALGWVDLTGPDFAALAAATLAIVYPSCAEAQAGSVTNAMHAGLIPVVSRETTTDVEPFGVLLPDASPEAIVAAVRALAAEPPERLAARARATWEAARTRYTRERYKAVLGGIVQRLMAEHPNLAARGFVPMPQEGETRPPAATAATEDRARAE